jgi:hypothetical protein
MAEPLAAQACTRTGTSGTGSSCTVTLNGTSVTFPWAAVLSSSSVTTAVPSVTPTMLNSSSQTVAGPTITGRANFAYTIQIAAGSSTWSYTGPAQNPNKPAAQLQWRATSGTNTTFRTASTTAAVLESSVTAGTSTSRALEFKITWSWATTPPGSYSLPLVVTLIAP